WLNSPARPQDIIEENYETFEQADILSPENDEQEQKARLIDIAQIAAQMVRNAALKKDP
ncbi:unnamed protein product, partial [Amoebophrya sp. A25]